MNIVRRFGNGKLIEFTIDGVDQLVGQAFPLADSKPLPSPRQRGIVALRKLEPWPIGLLLLIKPLARKGDRGAGDVIARVVGPVGGDAFKVWYKKIFGKDCGCNARQEDWNLRYPL